MAKSRQHYREQVEDYCNGVLSGDIVAGKLVKAAVNRFRQDLKHAAGRGLYLDDQRAAAMIDVFPLVLRHTTGEHYQQPFIPVDFQVFALYNLFGWRRKDNGFRRFNDAFVSCARGNGKTKFAAGILLTLFSFDWPVEPRAECYCVATTREQAKICFGECKRNVEQSQELSKVIQVYKHNLSIIKTASKLEPLASDSKNVDGLSIHGVIRDELHAWREQHRELYEKVETAMVKRRQPLAVTVTTAGNEDSAIWREQYAFSRDVVTGVVEADQHFSLIYEIDDEDDALDESCWPKANPMLRHGVVKIDAMRAIASKAKTRPETLHSFRRYHCNQFVRSASRLITEELWNSCDTQPQEIEPGATCFAGFDFGSRDDLAALALVFPLDLVAVRGEYRRRYAVKCWAWCCEEAPRDMTREPWAGFIRSGQLEITQGNTTDVQAIYDTVAELAETYTIKSLAFDPNNAREFGTRCQNDFGIQTFSFSQTCAKYNEPTRSFVAALAEGRILHEDHNLLRWCCMNMCVREDSRGYIMPSKKQSENKIDLGVALIQAFAEACYAEKPTGSVYEKRGPIML